MNSETIMWRVIRRASIAVLVTSWVRRILELVEEGTQALSVLPADTPNLTLSVSPV